MLLVHFRVQGSARMPVRRAHRCLQVISVIAFRGQNRSEAQYVISNSVGRTDGTGIVQQVGAAGRSRGWHEMMRWQAVAVALQLLAARVPALCSR